MLCANFGFAISLIILTLETERPRDREREASSPTMVISVDYVMNLLGGQVMRGEVTDACGHTHVR